MGHSCPGQFACYRDRKNCSALWRMSCDMPSGSTFSLFPYDEAEHKRRFTIGSWILRRTRRGRQRFGQDVFEHGPGRSRQDLSGTDALLKPDHKRTREMLGSLRHAITGRMAPESVDSSSLAPFCPISYVSIWPAGGHRDGPARGARKIRPPGA